MKLNPLILLTLSLCCGGQRVCFAEATLELKVASKATHRGLEEADLNLQPSFELGMGRIYAGAWSLQPLEGKGNGFEQRHEFYLGLSKGLSDKLVFDLGAIRYDNPSTSDDASEAYAGIWAELGTFSPSFYIYKDLDQESWAFEAATTVAIPLQGFPGEVTGRVGFVDRESDYRYFELDLIYPWEVNDSTRVALGLHYSDNDLGFGNPGSRVFGSAGMRWSF